MRSRIPFSTALLALLTSLLLTPLLHAQEAVLIPHTLRPGDVIRLNIWREPDFSGEFNVDRDGKVVFPRLGEVQVLDRNPEELEGWLVEEYRRYLVNPSIEITILRRVNVMGAVLRPGLYTADATITISDILAMAGGATAIGDRDRLRLIRDGNVISTTLSGGTRVGDSPIRSGDQIFVPERAWLSRNGGVIAASIGAFVTLIVALTR